MLQIYELLANKSLLTYDTVQVSSISDIYAM